MFSGAERLGKGSPRAPQKSGVGGGVGVGEWWWKEIVVDGWVEGGRGRGNGWSYGF